VWVNAGLVVGLVGVVERAERESRWFRVLVLGEVCPWWFSSHESTGLCDGVGLSGLMFVLWEEEWSGDGACGACWGCGATGNMLRVGMS